MISGGGGRGGGGSPKRQENITEECTERWVCDNWKPEVCPENGIQTRSCEEVNNCGTEQFKPSITKRCEYSAPVGEEIIVEEEKPKELFAPEEKPTYLWIYIVVLVIIGLGGGVGVVLYEKEHKVRERQRIQDRLTRMQDYIITNLAKGYSKEQLRSILLKNGWKEEMVDYVFKRLEDEKKKFNP